jgi:hypothetical protein
MALSTQPYLDEFDGTTLGAYYDVTGTWSVSDGNASLTDDSAGNERVLYETEEQDHHSEIYFTYATGVTRVFARYVDSDNFMVAELNNGSAKVLSKVGGTETVLFTGNAGVTVGQTHFIRLRIIGNALWTRIGNTATEHTIPTSLLTGTITGFTAPVDMEVNNFLVARPDSEITAPDRTNATAFPTAVVVNRPVITVSGEAVTTITVNDPLPTFTYSAEDVEDGTVTVTVGGDTPDNTTVGEYVQTFNAIDSDGNEAIEVTRTTIVEAENTSTLPDTRIRLIGIGDSIGNHIFDAGSHFVTYADTLNCDASIVNNANGGSFSFRMNEDLADDLTDAREVNNNMFVLIHGTNGEVDADGNGFPAYFNAFEIYTARIVARIHNAGYRAAIASKTRSAQENTSSYPTAGIVNTQNTLSESLTPEFYDYDIDRPLIDLFEITEGEHSNGWFIDNYHPSQTGEFAMLEYMANRLIPLVPDVFEKDSGLKAFAGDHQQATKSSTVTLSATATDTDGNAMSYTWEQVYGETVTIQDAFSQTATFTAPNLDRQLIFRVKVSNGYDTDFSDVIVDVGDSLNPDMYDPDLVDNAAPTANAGPDQSVAAGVTVQLDASSSTPGTNPIALYEWTQTAGDTVALEDETTATPTFESPVTTTAQRVSFDVIAIDTDGNRSAAAAVHIDVAAFETSALLKLLDTRRWELHHDGTVQAFEGRANREAFRFKLIPDDGVLNDADGFFRFDQPGIDSVEVLSSTSSSVSSTDDPDMIREVVIAARTGDLKGEDPNNLELTFVLYVTGDSDGLVMTASEMVPYQSASYFRR